MDARARVLFDEEERRLRELALAFKKFGDQLVSPGATPESVREAHTALQNAFVYAEGDIDRQELQLAALHSDMLDLADKEQTIHREIESTAKESDIAYNAVQLALQQRKLDDAAMLQARVVAAYPSRSESHREILSLCEEIAQLEQEGAKSAAMIERLRQLAAPALELLFLYSQTVLNASRNESVDDASKD